MFWCLLCSRCSSVHHLVSRQFGAQSAVGANSVQSALFWCRAALPILESLCCPPPPNSGAHNSGAPNSGAHSWCMVELGAAFRPSQARPKSTPSVFLILSRAASPHSQTFSTHVSLNPPPTPIPDFFIHELAAAHMITCQPYTAWPPPFIYTLCSASTCAPICQQPAALLIASVANIFQLAALYCHSYLFTFIAFCFTLNHKI